MHSVSRERNQIKRFYKYTVLPISYGLSFVFVLKKHNCKNKLTAQVNKIKQNFLETLLLRHFITYVAFEILFYSFF